MQVLLLARLRKSGRDRIRTCDLEVMSRFLNAVENPILLGLLTIISLSGTMTTHVKNAEK